MPSLSKHQQFWYLLFHPIGSGFSQLDCRICDRVLQLETENRKKTVWQKFAIAALFTPVNKHHWSVDVLYSAIYTFIDICRAIPATKLLSTSSYKLGFYRYGWGSSTFRNIAADSIYILIRGWLSMTQLLLEHSWRSHYNHNKLRCLSQGLHSKLVVVLSPCFSLWCHFWPVIKHCSSLSFQQLTVDTFLHSNWSSCSFLVSTEWLTITAGSYGERSINQSINQ